MTTGIGKAYEDAGGHDIVDTPGITDDRVHLAKKAARLLAIGMLDTQDGISINMMHLLIPVLKVSNNMDLLDYIMISETGFAFLEEHVAEEQRLNI